MARATRAVVSEPDTGCANSSTRNTRSASPSKARPTSACEAITAVLRSRRFSSWIGSAGWLGKVPSSSPKRISSSTGSPLEGLRDHEATHTVGRVGHDLERAQRGGVDERADVLGVFLEHLPPLVATRLRHVGRTRDERAAAAWSRTSASPVSCPTGRAPARHILIPLYAAGLCDAVNMAPGASSRPEAKYIMSVEASPRSTTSAPALRAPAEKAAASSTPDSRMSRATMTRGVPAKRAKAQPMARQSRLSSWSGTVPRTS